MDRTKKTERDASWEIAKAAAKLAEAEGLWDDLGRDLLSHDENIMKALRLCQQFRYYVFSNARSEVKKIIVQQRRELTRLLNEAGEDRP